MTLVVPDLIIRSGTILDGSGGDPFDAEDAARRPRDRCKAGPVGAGPRRRRCRRLEIPWREYDVHDGEGTSR